jgi:hypothetical protein
MFFYPPFYDSFIPLVTLDNVPNPGYSLAMDIRGGSVIGS